MTIADPASSADDEVLARLKRVPRPERVLSRAIADALSPRQSEILDDLSGLFDNGFAHLTMADIAKSVNCSLRTLYGLANSRDELVLIVIDRSLWRIGRVARLAITPGMAPLDAIRSYLRAANVAVANTTEPFARDTDLVPGGRALADAHRDYVVAVTRALLNEAVRRGDIARCDTAAVARVIASLGTDMARPEVLSTLRSSPKKAADDMVDVILRGLR